MFLSSITGALITFAMQFLKVNWNLYGELFLGIVSLGDGILLVFMAKTSEIRIAYLFYVIFRASYQMVITIARYGSLLAFYCYNEH